MQTLNQYIATVAPDRTHEEWAAIFGISRSYFTDIVNGRVRPGTKVMERINIATGGQVPPGVWFQPQEAAE